MNHLVILPILIPLLGAALSLFVEHRRYGPRVQRAVAWTAQSALALAVGLLFATTASGEINVYLLGDWPSRLGIALVADRLSAWMLLTTLLLAIPCLLHACSGWDRRAPHFHALFQFQLVGLNGAFLTGDIFNLFVFFEVMLIASYGLLLSGGRGLRMRIGLHYVVFNVTASTLFLVALGLLYASLGSLNTAELSQRIAEVPPAQLTLVKATMGLLLLVFCAKAALMPLYLWLPEAYSRAPAAVAALFAIMTKVGLYSVLRIQMLWFGDDAGDSFMAWNFASAVETIASRGKAEYDLPCYANAWLKQYPWNPGSYPAGGPIPEVQDIWRCAAPSLFTFGPDIYVPYCADIFDEYTTDINPLFIPEIRKDAVAASYCLYAFGAKNAICFSPFGIEELALDPSQIDRPPMEVMIALNIVTRHSEFLTDRKFAAK